MVSNAHVKRDRRQENKCLDSVPAILYFLGTVERSLLGKENQTAYEQGAGAEGTVILQEYLSSLNINLLDTRGFWDVDDELANEYLNVMTGK